MKRDNEFCGSATRNIYSRPVLHAVIEIEFYIWRNKGGNHTYGTRCAIVISSVHAFSFYYYNSEGIIILYPTRQDTPPTQICQSCKKEELFLKMELAF